MKKIMQCTLSALAAVSGFVRAQGDCGRRNGSHGAAADGADRADRNNGADTADRTGRASFCGCPGLRNSRGIETTGA